MDYLGDDLIGKQKKIKISFMGWKQAGCIGLLSLCATKCDIISVVAYDEMVKIIAEKLNFLISPSIKEDRFVDALYKSDLLVSVHGKEVVPPEMLRIPSLGCINVHPCLYKYKGVNPIEKLLRDNNTKASVGVHYMSEEVDSGEVIVEKFVDVSGKNTIEEVYNQLYPYYALVILEAIDKIREKNW